ncbi:MAG: PQQ-binding-like beta-propeller repeat protein [Planctomycetes bacterium]|nr:PQQ-binding-like beta-propeller repeat protein [Planctomycetota bacterium]
MLLARYARVLVPVVIVITLAAGEPATGGGDDLPPSVRATVTSWPMFRGDPQLTGVARSALPEQLSVQWKFEAAEPITSSAAIVDGTVFVGCHDEWLYALSLDDGSLRWKYHAQGPVQSSPLAVGPIVVFGDDEGTIHAVERSSGKVRWTYQTDGQVISSPNYQAGRVLVGSYDGCLYCLAGGDGKLIWKHKTDGYVHGAPGIRGDSALVAGCDERLHVVRLADGEAVTTVSMKSVSGSSPAVSDSLVFVGTYGNRVLGIDIPAARIAWAFEDPDRQFPFMASAAITPDAIVIGGRDKRVRSLDPTNGKDRWTFATGARVDSSAAIVGERVFVGSSDGVLYELDLRSGRELWRFESGAPITASPAVAAARLIIGNEDGVLYCLGGAGKGSD